MKNLIVLFIAALAFALPAGAQTETDRAISFMSYLSTKIVLRPLNASELSMLRAQGAGAFGTIASAWANEAVFARSFQLYIENLTQMSGEAGGINYNLPGFLGREIAKRKKPYAELLTSNTCYDAQGNAIACDTQAPYTAGILTTRAYMVKYKGAYNIGRAGKLTSRFLCTTFPLSASTEPPLLESDLIEQFATTSGKITFGNGNNCYSCHSQFGLHAQLFVKFDLGGIYRADASGVQQAGTTDGFAANSTLVSHLKDPARARSEQTRILGRNVANLADAAKAMVQSPLFYSCAVQNLMRYYLRLSDANIASVKVDLYNQIAAQAKQMRAEPSPSDLLLAIIINPNVYSSFKKSGALP